MTRTITQRIRRLLATAPPRETVHFHLDRDGHAFVCDVARCDSPAVTETELDL
jgi:hypothetical protein